MKETAQAVLNGERWQMNKTPPRWCSECGDYLKFVDEKVIDCCEPGKCDKCSKITVERILSIEARLRELEFQNNVED